MKENMPTKAPRPVPEGMHTVTPHLWFTGNCREAVEFYQKAFGAEATSPVVPSPDGKSVMHAMIKIGDSNLMMADAWPGLAEQGPQGATTIGLFLYVADCDALYERATRAGCEVIDAIGDMFWGDRMGKVKDPFGHVWAIATHKWLYTPEEMQKGQDEWQASLKK